FHLLRFTGATPVDHLMRLRSSEPVIINGGLGGIISFPSFHATVATLTPLTLRRYRGLFFALLILDAAMLIRAFTEGAHYAADIRPRAGVASAPFFLAGRPVGAVDPDRRFGQGWGCPPRLCSLNCPPAIIAVGKIGGSMPHLQSAFGIIALLAI